MGLVGRLENTYKNEIMKVNKFVIQNSDFICFTYDEVTTMDNTSLASVHGYIVQNWSWITLLLNVWQMLLDLGLIVCLY
jgi:hypothetical protein